MPEECRDREKIMHILIVEDEKKVAAFLRQALEEAGYDVDVAGDGEAGFQALQNSDCSYDLLILDWLLPRRSGLEVCRAVRKQPSCITIPILMLTARDALENRILGLDTGADDYLTKPFALGELLARVRALLRRSSAAPPSAAPPVLLHAGDLMLDPETRRVERGGREIVLSAREFELLEYLLRHTGRTLTRALITQHVWDIGFDSGTNVVDVYINYLRNKIDRGQKTTLIQTIRGVGYRLEARLAEENDAVTT